MKLSSMGVGLLALAYFVTLPQAHASFMTSASVACPDTGQATIIQTGTAAANATNQCGFANTFFNSGTASATADHGILTGTAEVDGRGYAVNAAATSHFSEVATAEGGSGTALVTFTFLVTGQVSEDGGQNAAPFTVTQGSRTIFSLGDGDIQQAARDAGNCLRSCGVNLVYTTQPESFNFGVPFFFDATLTAKAFNTGGFADTDLQVQLQSINVTDANGNRGNFQVSFDGVGTGQEMPEPDTWTLAVLGLAAFGMCFRWNRFRHRY